MTARKTSSKRSPSKSTAKKAGAKADPLVRMRRIIAAWPETDERISHGMPTFWGGKKTFARFVNNHHGDGILGAWIKVGLETQETLVAADPKRYFVPAYVGKAGWVGVRFDAGRIDWGTVEELLEAGYRSGAPKRALQILDAR